MSPVQDPIDIYLMLAIYLAAVNTINADNQVEIHTLPEDDKMNENSADVKPKPTKLKLKR